MTPAARISDSPAPSTRRKLDIYLKVGDGANIAALSYADQELVSDLLSGSKPVGDGDKTHLRVLRHAHRLSRLNQEKAFNGPKLKRLTVDMSAYMYGLVTQSKDSLL
jgi:hypothetical protein